MNKRKYVFSLSIIKIIIVMLQSRKIESFYVYVIDMINKLLNIRLFNLSLPNIGLSHIKLPNIFIFKVLGVFNKIIRIRKKLNNKKDFVFLEKIKVMFNDTKNDVKLTENLENEIDEKLDVDINIVKKVILKKIKNTEVKKILLVKKK
jgi:hypothetical protein